MSAGSTALSMNIVLNSAIRGSQFLQASTKGIHTYSAKLEKIKLLKATNFPVLNRQIQSLDKNLRKIQAHTAKISRKPLNMMGVNESNQRLRENLRMQKAIERSTKQTAFYSRKDAQNHAMTAAAARHRPRRDVSVGMVTGAALAAAPLVLPLKTSFDFEEAITSVNAKTDTRFTKDIPLLRQTAVELGGSTEWTMTQVAKGEEYLTMAGFNPKEIAQSMRGNLALATVGDLDLGTSADISSNILTGYNLKAKAMDRVADVIAKTVTTSNTNITEMGEAQKYVATVATGLRGKNAFVETTALIGILANAGIKGSQAGTHLKGMMMRVAAPTKKSREAQAALGFHAFDDAGHAKPIHQMIGELKQKFKAQHYSQQQQVQAMKDIFGMIALPSAMALMTAGEQKIVEYQQRIDQSAGEALRIQQMKLDTPIGQLKLLGSAFSGLSIAMTSETIAPFKSFVRVATEGVNTVARFAKENPKLAAGIYTVGLALGVGTVALMAFGLVATLAGKGLRTLGLGGKKGCGGLSCLSGTAAGAAQSLGTMNKEVGAARSLFKSPLMLAIGIAGVAAVLAGLKKVAEASHQAIQDTHSITPTVANKSALEAKVKRLDARIAAAKGQDGWLSKGWESFVHGSNTDAKIEKLKKERARAQRNLTIAEVGGYKPPEPVNDPSYSPEQIAKAQAYAARMRAKYGTVPPPESPSPSGYVKPANNVLPVQSPAAVGQSHMAQLQTAQVTNNDNHQESTTVHNNVTVVAKGVDAHEVIRLINANTRQTHYQNKATQLKDIQ